MKLSFDQVLRLIVCVAGIIFFAVGVWMIKTGISAQGVIDIQLRDILSGRLQTGSAGLFVTFFSFGMITISFFLGRRPVQSKQKVSQSLPSRMPVMLVVLAVLWAATTGAYFVQRDTKITDESLLFGFLTLLLFVVSSIWSLLTVGFWLEEHDEKRQSAISRRDA